MTGDDVRLREAMVAGLVAAGVLRSPAWVDAFCHVPRHRFLRQFFRQSDDHAGWYAVAADDPGAQEMVYRDATWVTQLDSDPHRWRAAREAGEPVTGVPTSSSTAPGLMALMLEALDVHDGHRVLEIGTGTGYHAALLSHRLGADRVTTVEVDTDVAADAREALDASGYAPTVVAADGAAGWPDGAPYDRLIATCAVPTLAPAWPAQVRPGGAILTGLHRDLGGGALVRLRVDRDGGAEGHFLPQYGGFMPLHRFPPADAAARLDTALTRAEERTPRPSAIDPTVLDDPDFAMVAALRLPEVAEIWFAPAAGEQRWLLAADGAWACATPADGQVRQAGDRRLWDELECAYRQWAGDGRPARQRYGLTVAPDGVERFWLDEPAHVRWTVLA